MESAKFIRKKLANRTNSSGSGKGVKNNRYHYYLYFDESIGWDWLSSQVKKANNELYASLEMWEIHPARKDEFKVEVREVDRRPEIDESQHELEEFS